MLFVFYCIPILAGKEISPFAAAIISLSLYGGAYAAEVVRAGIESIEKGQWEAARSTGLSGAQLMRYIILPQAFRVMIPPGIGLFIAMVKDSSLVAILGVQDLTQLTRLYYSSNFLYMQSLTMLAFMYLVLVVVLTRLVRLMEHRLNRGYVR